MSRFAVSASLFAVLFTSQAALAQAAGAAPLPPTAPPPGAIASHPEWPQANPADVKTPEAIIAALSSAISGEAGKPRDWKRVRSLFLPGAGRLIVSQTPKNGASDVTVLTLDEYQARAGGQTFYEIPIAYEVESFGHITHVYESYGIYHKQNDPAPAVRGVNSWELAFDGTRYYIVQVLWDTERPDNPLPAALQPAAQ